MVKNRDSSELAARNTPVRDKKTGGIGTLQIGAGFTLSTTQDNNVTQYDKNRIKQRGSRDKAGKNWTNWTPYKGAFLTNLTPYKGR